MNIKDVVIKDLTHLSDDRGGFAEVFRTEWFPDYDHSNIQLNNSTSIEFVLRGMHYHYNQYDYWYVVQGLLQVALVDLRKTSETFGEVETLFLSSNNGLFIPPQIAHGFLSIQPTELIYVVNQYFNPEDELGLKWNDEMLKVPWAIQNPIISERDENNPILAEVLHELK